MPPHTTQMSATLNTAKWMNRVWNMSVTYPNTARSIRLPTAPASTRDRVSMARGWGNTFFSSSTTRATDTTRDTTVRIQVCWEKMEKAAPVFCT